MFADDTEAGTDFGCAGNTRSQVLDLMLNCFSQIDVVRQTQMAACYTPMLGFDERLDIGFDAAARFNADIVTGLLHHNKLGRPNKPALLVHSSHDWAGVGLRLTARQSLNHLSVATGNGNQSLAFNLQTPGFASLVIC